MAALDLIAFFKDRILELLNLNTIDSHRVRYHNARTVLDELRHLIMGWENITVKRSETIELCLKDVTSILNADEVLSYPNLPKKEFIDYLTSFVKTLEKSNKQGLKHSEYSKIMYLLDSILEMNQKTYLENLFQIIEDYIVNEKVITEEQLIPTLSKFDNYVSSLIRELLSRGFSKRGLYNLSTNFSHKSNDIESFRQFKKELTENLNRKHKVILALNLTGLNDKFALSLFLKDMPLTDIPNKYLENQWIKNFLEQKKNKRFFVYEGLASDGDSAIKCAKNSLFSELDTLHMFMGLLNVSYENNALVVRYKQDSKDVLLLPTKFFLDGKYSKDTKNVEDFRQNLGKISNNNNISEDAKDRIKSALRHLRIGDIDAEIEQRFINYWVGLEYLFSSPKVEENTFLRLKENLCNILTANYTKRNVRDLESKARKLKALKPNERIFAENIDTIRSNTSNLLLRYRLSQYKSYLFVNSEKRKAFVKRHESNLQIHLSRIYHLRNELIHEAAINQDIEDLTSNLRYYLVTVLKDMTDYFSSQSSIHSLSIDSYFFEMYLRKSEIERDWSIKVLLKENFNKS